MLDLFTCVVYETWVLFHYCLFHKEVKPAGRANSYSTRITDLMTSLKDEPEQSPRLNQMIEAGALVPRVFCLI